MKGKIALARATAPARFLIADGNAEGRNAVQRGIALNTFSYDGGSGGFEAEILRPWAFQRVADDAPLDESEHTRHSVAHRMTIAIIGGGAAGLMAAASALVHNTDAEIVLIERNPELGKKVIISGGGRCNVTTGLDEIREVLKRYPRGGKFLTSALHQFPPATVRAWFEDHGVPIKIEEDLRAFPVSDNGHDIVAAFKRLFIEAAPRLRVLLDHVVISVKKTGDTFVITFRTGETLRADKLILTTGGQAYRHTGSTGDGYAFAESLGHSLTPLAPSLNSFFTRETWPKDVSGLSFERAKISAAEFLGHAADASIHPSASWTGPFLFTHKGVSGPAVFALSGLVAFRPYDAHAPLRISIDLFPDESLDKLTKRVDEAMRSQGKKAVHTVLATFVPKSLAEMCCKEHGIGPEVNAGDLTKDGMRALSEWLKGIPLTVIGRGAGDEFVTAGGVSLTEVDPSTMESKITPGLYFAGELLDVDGFTGGFNLQASWATGRLAGESAAAA